MGAVTAKILEVTSIEGILSSKTVVTSKVKARGVALGITGDEALRKLLKIVNVQTFFQTEYILSADCKKHSKRR
jgi:hypothetical protein